jgi:hypothetical protein
MLRYKRLAAVLVLGAALGACETMGPGSGQYPGQPTSPVPLPANGPIAYTCSDGTQLTVDVEGNQARVAIVGGPSMVLPSAGEGYYSNGRYAFRGGGANGQWEVGRRAAVDCRGS